MKTQDKKFKISANVNRATTIETGTGYEYLAGEIVTKYGIVSALAQSSERVFSILDFAFGGYHYLRSFPGVAYTKRGLSLKASQFARDIVTGTYVETLDEGQCEGCGEPATTSDSEGVSLCEECGRETR